jgi:cation:H+ antiporter
LVAYLAMAAGLVCAAAGSELFLRGTVGIAAAARVAPAIIATTVAAFATSSPELTVAITSALAGEPEISFGDALGSNVANIALILGAALLFGPLSAPRQDVKRDYLVALLTSALIGLLTLDGRLSRIDAAILLAGFLLWIAAVLRAAGRQRSAPQAKGPDDAKGAPLMRVAAETLSGFVLLVAEGKLIVFGASEIARALGASDFFIGATIVSIGTSTPELAMAIMSRLRGHDEVGLGALLGSNIFNGLFIVGVAGSIAPFNVLLAGIWPALVFGGVALALAYPSPSGALHRWRGAALLAVYLAYFIATAVTPWPQ